MNNVSGGEIKFYYKTDSLFDRCKIMSAYKANSIKTESGESMLDEYAMTDDEKDAFLVILEDVIFNAGMKFRKLHADVTEGVFFDTVIPQTDPDKANGFTIIDHDAYNENLLSHVDNHTRAYIVSHVLYEWYKLKNLADLAKLQEVDMLRASGNLDKTIFQFYKPLINT